MVDRCARVADWCKSPNLALSLPVFLEPVFGLLLQLFEVSFSGSFCPDPRRKAGNAVLDLMASPAKRLQLLRRRVGPDFRIADVVRLKDVFGPAPYASVAVALKAGVADALTTAGW